MPIRVRLCVCAWRKEEWECGKEFIECTHGVMPNKHNLQSLQSNLTVNVCRHHTSLSVSLSLSDTVMKSCTYRGFCDKANGGNSGAKMECCFGDDCNGPHRSHSHGEIRQNSAGALASSPVLLVTALLMRMAFSQQWTPPLFCPSSDSPSPPHLFQPVICYVVHSSTPSSLSLCPSEIFSW